MTWPRPLSEALEPVAELLGKTADLIGQFIHSARGAGEDITAALYQARSSFSGGEGADEYAQSIFNAHKEGKLFTDVMNEQLDVTKKNIEFQQLHGIGLGKLSDTYKDLNKEQDAGTTIQHKYGEAAKDNSGEIEKLKSAVQDLETSYWSARSDIDRSLGQLVNDHKQKMAQINEAIKTTRDAMDDLERSYGRSTGSTNTSEADVINSEKDKIADLENQLKKLNLERERVVNQGGGVPVELTMDIEDTQKQLDQHKTSLANMQSKAGPDVTAIAEVRGGKTDNENRFDDLEKQRAQQKEDHDLRLTQLQEELDKNNEKATAEQKAFTDQQTALKDTKTAMIDFHDTYISNLDDLSKVTQETLNDMKTKLEDLKTTISNIDALLKAKKDITGGTTVTEKAKARAAGGVVTESMTLVGERGPELVSLPYGSKVYPNNESRSMSGSISITIGKIEMNSEMDIRQAAEMLAREIQKRTLGSS